MRIGDTQKELEFPPRVKESCPYLENGVDNERRTNRTEEL